MDIVGTVEFPGMELDNEKVVGMVKEGDVHSRFGDEANGREGCPKMDLNHSQPQASGPSVKPMWRPQRQRNTDNCLAYLEHYMGQAQYGVAFD